MSDSDITKAASRVDVILTTLGADEELVKGPNYVDLQAIYPSGPPSILQLATDLEMLPTIEDGLLTTHTVDEFNIFEGTALNLLCNIPEPGSQG